MDSFFSRLPGFFDLDILSRRALLCERQVLTHEDFKAELSLLEADKMSENVISTFSLPLAVAANFIIDEQPVLVPMVTEEPSIVAACSKMAKLIALCSGFKTEISASLISGQIQLYNLRDIDHALEVFSINKNFLLEKANSFCPAMYKRGGGVIDIKARVLSSAMGPMLIIEPLMDVIDAMGANILNTVLENLAQEIRVFIMGEIGLRILSNLCDKRLASSTCEIPFRLLADSTKDNGLEIAQKLMWAHALAEVDIYRATTHNKGIMNGIDAVAMATGNDFRAIEASVHAYASRNGRYQALTNMSMDLLEQKLKVKLTVPMAIGVVGGISGFHSGVKLAHKILGEHASSAKKLSSVIVSVGLAQCLAALLALSKEGIQRGHMRLHHKKTILAGP
jgi:hydroxymethylglutaryl-CoA reductase